MDNDEKLRRAGRAEGLLRDETFQEALTALRNEAHAMWAQTRPNETEARELVYHHLQAIDGVERKLNVWVSEAKVIQHKSNEDKA